MSRGKFVSPGECSKKRTQVVTRCVLLVRAAADVFVAGERVFSYRGANETCRDRRSLRRPQMLVVAFICASQFP
jgi:hypothetical protein